MFIAELQSFECLTYLVLTKISQDPSSPADYHVLWLAGKSVNKFKEVQKLKYDYYY